MKYCGFCGKEMSEEMIFCPFCGKKQSQETSSESHTPNTQSISAPGNKKRRTLKLLICVFALLMLCVFGFVYFTYTKPFSEDVQKINTAAESVVMISCYDHNGNIVSTGSGFIVFSDDILVTNYHVIDYSLNARISTEQDKTYSVSQLIAYSEEHDVAILQLEDHTNLPVLPLGDSDIMEKGTPVTAIGSPLGIKNTVSTGILSGRLWNGEAGMDELQFTAPISSGSSGGALFNENGEVIGVTYASIVDGQNINLAIPVEIVANIYDAKTVPITLQELFENKHKGYNYYRDSLKIEYSDLLENPHKYIGSLISIVGYVAEAEDHSKHWLYLLPSEEYKTWLNEPSVLMRSGIKMESYDFYHLFLPFEETLMIECRDHTNSIPTKTHIGNTAIITGEFDYEIVDGRGIASIELLYAESLD